MRNLLRKTEEIKIHFKFKDILQIIMGAAILSMPIGFTEETWRLGETLPLMNILGLLALSIIFISMFTFYHYHKHVPERHWNIFSKRVVFTYLFSFLVVSVILTLIQRAPWLSEPLIALKRTVVVAFPSSISAAIADTIK